MHLCYKASQNVPSFLDVSGWRDSVTSKHDQAPTRILYTWYILIQYHKITSADLIKKNELKENNMNPIGPI